MEEAAYKGEDEEQEKEFVLKDILSVRNYTQLHGDLLLLRLEMKSGDEALRADMRQGDEALRAEISSLRTDMQSEFKAMRSEIKQGDDALRAEINALRSDMQRDYEALRAEINELRAETHGEYSSPANTLLMALNKKYERPDDFQKSQTRYIVLVMFVAALVCSVASSTIIILARHFMR